MLNTSTGLIFPKGLPLAVFHHHHHQTLIKHRLCMQPVDRHLAFKNGSFNIKWIECLQVMKRAFRRTDSICSQNGRRFPNEVFALIIQSLSNDYTSLRNISLVCKDFSHISQPYIFRELRLLNGNRRSYPRYQSLKQFAQLPIGRSRSGRRSEPQVERR